MIKSKNIYTAITFLCVFTMALTFELSIDWRSLLFVVSLGALFFASYKEGYIEGGKDAKVNTPRINYDEVNKLYEECLKEELKKKK
jgi:hypothetical protein